MRELFIQRPRLEVVFAAAGAFIWLTVHKIIAEPNPADAHRRHGDHWHRARFHCRHGGGRASLSRHAEHRFGHRQRLARCDFRTLSANQIRATVDLTEIDAAKDLKRRVDVSVPSGITLLKVDPPQVGVVIPPIPIKK
jgi:hypothetical protein